jgi:hypothetical protein
MKQYEVHPDCPPDQIEFWEHRVKEIRLVHPYFIEIAVAQKRIIEVNYLSAKKFYYQNRTLYGFEDAGFNKEIWAFAEDYAQWLHEKSKEQDKEQRTT